MFNKFKEAGLVVIPENNGVPLKGVEWSKYNLENVPNFPDGASGYGLICGEVSNIIGLDIDTDDQAIINQVESIAGVSPIKKKGSKGYTAFFRYNGEKSQVWKKEGEIILELLSNGRKTTIPPSKYKNTEKTYEYIIGDLLDKSIELPYLNDKFVEVMDMLYPRPKRKEIKFESVSVLDKVSFAEAEDMLSYISPDCSYDEWIAVGMALRSEFGDSAFQAWDNWSSKSSKYQSSKMYNHWRSFDDYGIGIGTLVWLAQEAGYIKKSEVTVNLDDYSIDVSYLEKKDLEQNRDIKAHGLVGMIANWITETAIRPQPQLALGAALTFVGMLKGHFLSTSSGLRTNFLGLNIAPTASGKEHPEQCIIRLMDACGLDKHLMSEPQSGTALLRGILSSERVGLLTIDEVGRFIANISNKNSGGYQKEIIDYIIKTFSKANGKLVGKQYANEKLNPKIRILEPHLCVLGSSVKEKLTEACTSSDTIDGFLNRWVLFESTKRPKRQDIERKEVPENIIEAVKQIIDLNPNKQYPLQDDQAPVTKVVKYTPEAYALMTEYSERIESLIDTAKYPLDALYGRSCEHVSKLALILCDNMFVRPQDVNLAIEIVTESNKLVASFAGLISDNQTEADYIKVREIIKKEKEIDRAKLTIKTQFVNGGKRRRNEILQDLIDSNEIRFEEKGKKVIFFSCMND